MYQHPRCNTQSFFQAGCSVTFNFCHKRNAPFPTKVLQTLRLQRWHHKAPMAPFGFLPELTPLHSPTFQRAEIIPIPDIPRKDEPNLPREHTSVHHSPTSFQKSQYSKHHMVSSYLVGNTKFLNNKITSTDLSKLFTYFSSSPGLQLMKLCE